MTVSATPHLPQTPPADLPARLLARHFGHTRFNPGQREPIDALLSGVDAVVVMPTGAGKSLCFQLPALAFDGITLVVSPLISLMKDQVDGLVKRGIPATCLNSMIPLAETDSRMAALRRGEIRLVYVAPERFRNRRFQELLAALRIAMLAIDEAHCISQWGHDFRPDYLRLGEVAKMLPKARILALTATATPTVRDDIIRQLGLGCNGRAAPRVFVRGFRRDNLRLVVAPCRSHAEKRDRIRRILCDFPTGIVYCSTRKQVERVGGMLADIRIPHLTYHAGLPDEVRTRGQERFLRGDIPVVVATNAFGMGVDRADLRFVVHWDIPGSIEAYYQEVGRAGRDGALAHCELLYNYADVSTQQFFLDGSNPEPELVRALWREVREKLLPGPQTLSQEEWSEVLLSTENKITVHTCMGLFDRAGLIRRQVQGGRRRCYTTTLAPDGDIARLEALLPGIEAKRRRDQQKLDTLLRYVHARGCRRRFILDYFGEASAIRRACGHCDVCGFAATLPPRPPTETEWPVLQKLLSCVGRLSGQCDRTGILAFARGTAFRAPDAETLKALPSYGILRDHPERLLRCLFDQLVANGAIAWTDSPNGIAELTPLGREVAWRRHAVSLQWPSRQIAAPPTRQRQPRPLRERSEPRPAASAVSRAAPSASAQTIDSHTLSAAETQCFNALKEWRREVARGNAVPAFTICGNRTLKAIAIARPTSLETLEQVHGMGPVRVDAFGDAILAVVQSLP